jgi:hypothetical protein
VAVLGLVGVASLMLLPLPPDIGSRIPAISDWPPSALKALLLLNPALLVIVMAMIGAALAHRVGLGSLVAGTASRRGGAGTLARCAVSGGALGIGLAAVDALILPHLGEAGQRLSSTSASGGLALAVGVWYGGLAEEVMLRWGSMSLVAWGLSSLPGWRRKHFAIAMAAVVAAGLFAAAHLPALAAHVELTPLVVARTLLLNGVAGLVYGWLFWRHHLEAAMASHSATHLGLWTWRELMP